MNTITVVVSFRAHRNFKSWLEYAGHAFKSESEMLALLLTEAAFEQATVSKASRLVASLLGGKRERLGVGNTAVFAARLSIPISELVRECAERRSKSTSEWCSDALLDWYHIFHELYQLHEGEDTAWLSSYAENLRSEAVKTADVYAQKRQKQGSEPIK